jgi:ribosomal protein S18 acetylase RimI-like enzyme
MNSGIVFRTATVSEHDKVLQFLREHFFPQEPINSSYPIKDDSMEEEFILSLLPAGNIILAIDSSSSTSTDSSNNKNNSTKIAGMLAFGKITKSYSQESWDESEITTNLKWRDILKFMSHIESKSNVCERFGVKEALHIHSTTVDKEYRGRSIGKMLFNECFRIAKERNFQLVSADCTSVYSIRIAKSLSMEHISTVTYDEYNEKIGFKMFNPVLPHTEIQTFVFKQF